jgi:hypothetical protein
MINVDQYFVCYYYVFSLVALTNSAILKLNFSFHNQTKNKFLLHNLPIQICFVCYFLRNFMMSQQSADAIFMLQAVHCY